MIFHPEFQRRVDGGSRIKIIGKSSENSFIVEMSKDEIMLAAGCTSQYDEAWRQITRGRGEPPIGAVIDCRAAYSFHSQVINHREQCIKSAGFLRSLADMLEHGAKDIVIMPETDDGSEKESIS